MPCIHNKFFNLCVYPGRIIVIKLSFKLLMKFSNLSFSSMHKIPEFHLIYRNCAFPQNFYSRILGEISVFYLVFGWEIYKGWQRYIFVTNFNFKVNPFLTIWYIYDDLVQSHTSVLSIWRLIHRNLSFNRVFVSCYQMREFRSF